MVSGKGSEEWLTPFKKGKRGNQVGAREARGQEGGSPQDTKRGEKLPACRGAREGRGWNHGGRNQDGTPGQLQGGVKTISPLSALGRKRRGRDGKSRGSGNGLDFPGKERENGGRTGPEVKTLGPA